MRLFIAIDFGQEREYFSELQKKLHFPDSKLAFTKAFHLTLKFLGEVQPNNLEFIKTALESIRHNKFSVCLDSVGVFPSVSCLRVVWVGLKPEDNVLELQGKIDESLRKLFNKERNFKSHITLARVKHAKDREEFAKELKTLKVEPRAIDINEFLLVKSDLKPAGPVYTTIAKFQLS